MGWGVNESGEVMQFNPTGRVETCIQLPSITNDQTETTNNGVAHGEKQPRKDILH